MLPLIERAPSRLPDAGPSLAQTYVATCRAAGREPNSERAGRLIAVLRAAGVIAAEDRS